MSTGRQIEIFSAGCPLCDDAIALVNSLTCPSCTVTVLDMHKVDAQNRAEELAIRSIPGIVINGKLADCCQGRGVDKQTLQASGSCNSK